MPILPPTYVWIGRKFHKGLGRRLHEDAVKRFLVLTHQFPQLLWQGEDHMEIDNRQKFGPPLFQPLFSVLPMALGTSAIFAGMIRVIKLAAMITLDQMAAKGLCSALGNVPQGSPVTGQHLLAVQVQIFLPVPGEDIG